MGDKSTVVYALGGARARDRDLERLDQDNYLDPAGPIVRANSSKETVEQLHTHLLAAAADYGAAVPTGRSAPGTAGTGTGTGPAAAPDADDALLVGTAAAQRRKRRRKVRKNEVQSIGRPFARVLEESGLAEGGVRAAAAAPSWTSCAARAPVRPRRWFCAMCGAPGVYQCPVCRTRCCSRRCCDAHREVRCLKSVR